MYLYYIVQLLWCSHKNKQQFTNKLILPCNLIVAELCFLCLVFWTQMSLKHVRVLEAVLQSWARRAGCAGAPARGGALALLNLGTRSLITGAAAPGLYLLSPLNTRSVCLRMLPPGRLIPAVSATRGFPAAGRSRACSTARCHRGAGRGAEKSHGAWEPPAEPL